MKLVCQNFSLAIFAIACALVAETSLGQALNLPKGIGIYGYGYRHYEPQTHKYNNEGSLEPLGAPFSKEFKGRNLLDGAGGADLKRLANELRKFDGNSNSPDSLLNSIDLGTLNADVTGKISAQAFALGYGVTDYLTLFTSIPWVEASVDTSLSFSGPNNAQFIKQRLGDVAFDELKTGLDTASAISAEEISDSITGLGYADPSHWEYSGLGDIDVGSILSYVKPIRRRMTAVQTLKTTLTLPTGYYEDPGILTDVSIGRGYYLLTNQYLQTLQFGNFWAQGDVAFGYGLPTKKQKRVPEEDEALVDQEREVEVTLQPGSDIGYGGTVGYAPGWLRFAYRLGVNRHLRDHYSGSLPGNYDKLSEDSSTYQFYQEPTVTIDTVRLYEKKRFLVPFIAGLKAHLPIQAKNSLNERYYELSVSSFFNTPYASTTKPHKASQSTKLSSVKKARKGRYQKTPSNSRHSNRQIAH